MKSLLAASCLLLAPAAQAYTLSQETPIFVGSMPDSVAIADIDGDGRDDVVLSTAAYFDTAHDFHDFVYLQNSSGTLFAAGSFGFGGRVGDAPMIATDLDGDGKAEIINGRFGGLTITRMLGGTFDVRRIDAELTPAKLLVMDVDRDGYRDIIAQTWTSGATIFFGDAIRSYGRRSFLDTPAFGTGGMAIADVDQDGFPDLVMATGYAAIAVMLHDRGHGFLPAQILPMPTGIEGVAAGDFNGDGRIDLVAGRPANSPTSLYVSTRSATGSYAAPSMVPTYDLPGVMVAGDFDTNGLADVAVLHRSFHALGLYLQGAQGLAAEQTFPSGTIGHSDPHALAVGDLNSDGCPDLADASYSDGLEIHYGSGCVTVDLAVSATATSFARVVARIDNPSADPAYKVDAAVTLRPAVGDKRFRITSVPAGCVLITPPYGYGCAVGTVAAGTSRELAFGLDSAMPTRVDVAAYTSTHERELGNNTMSTSTHRAKSPAVVGN